MCMKLLLLTGSGDKMAVQLFPLMCSARDCHLENFLPHPLQIGNPPRE